MRSQALKPPVARRVPSTTSLHGRERVDEYAWLRAENWREVLTDPGRLGADIRAYLEAENEYTEEVMSSEAAVIEALYREMRARVPEDDVSVPDEDGAFAYYTRYVKNGEYPIYARHPRGDPEREEVLLDTNAEAAEHKYFSVGSCQHSPDHRYIACCIDTKGAEYYTLEVREAATGERAAAPVERVQAGVAWANDSRRLVYVRLDDEHRPEKVFLHKVDQSSSDGDEELFRHPDPRLFLEVDKTRNKKFILLCLYDHESTEVHLVSADAPQAGASLIHAREEKLEYYVEEKNGELIIFTNADGHEDYKIMSAPLGTPSRRHWRDLIVPPPGVLLENVQVAENFLVRSEREDGLPRLVVARDDGEHQVAFDSPAHEVAVVPTSEYASDDLRFVFTSPTTPRQIFDYDTGTRRRVLRKEQRVPSGHDPDDYRVHRVMVPAADGERVPVTLLRARGTPLDAGSPMMVYGYGAYGYSLPASFSPYRLSLVDRGFIYALAHVRGGKEKGYTWYRNGKLEHKRNTISDFIAVIEHLCERHYTRKDRVAIQGASAGGILVGAAANQRPDLFRAVVAEVPFVDVLNTICDPSLPLTPPEWGEWGNPIEDAEAYETILAYSPYDNVKRQDYPHMLVMSSVSDPRVTYWEPAKWVARLRALRANDNYLLLKTNLEAGHAGASGRYESIRETALIHAFLLKVFGLPITRKMEERDEKEEA